MIWHNSRIVRVEPSQALQGTSVAVAVAAFEEAVSRIAHGGIA